MGTFNSGCAKIIIPILNRATPGPMGMVSPANTEPGLTKSGPGAEPGEPDKYYPTGHAQLRARRRARRHPGTCGRACWRRSSASRSVFILNDKQTYGFGVATTFRGAAAKLGLKVAGFQGWDAKQSSYEALANTIKQTGADAVFLGGIICNNGAKLIKDLKAGVPDANADRSRRLQRLRSRTGPAFEGSYVSVAGQPPKGLKGEGKTFVDDFGAQIGATPNPYSAVRARRRCSSCSTRSQASDGTRASVAENLFGLR